MGWKFLTQRQVMAHKQQRKYYRIDIMKCTDDQPRDEYDVFINGGRADYNIEYQIIKLLRESIDCYFGKEIKEEA
jgi:hypothetical protein